MSKQQLQVLTDDVKQMKGRKNNRTQKVAHFCIPAQFCQVADEINFTKKVCYVRTIWERPLFKLASEK